MPKTNGKIKQMLRGWFLRCPIAHSLCLLAIAIIGAYFALRGDGAAMARLSEGFVRPWHRFFSRATAALPFSLGECLIVLAILSFLLCTVVFLVRLIVLPQRGARIYRFCIGCAAAVALIYAGFCVFWGPYYSTSDFEDQSGIRGAPLSAEQLETVTRYFTLLVNDYAAQVPRAEDGSFAAPLEEIFAAAPTLYRAVAQDFPCLSGEDIPAKPFFFSRCLSYLNFTGFFFPFTAEANINVDCPAALIPATIAHELAHQRGVAQEDEANFVAVLASFADGNAVYCYSAALQAYIYLGNALYKVDYDAWLENYISLCDEAKRDLAAQNAYWAQFETPVGEASDAVYTGFLQSYGQTLGLQTYGKCIDLLVAYYYDAARTALG